MAFRKIELLRGLKIQRDNLELAPEKTPYFLSLRFALILASVSISCAKRRADRSFSSPTSFMQIERCQNKSNS